MCAGCSFHFSFLCAFSPSIKRPGKLAVVVVASSLLCLSIHNSGGALVGGSVAMADSSGRFKGDRGRGPGGPSAGPSGGRITEPTDVPTASPTVSPTVSPESD